MTELESLRMLNLLLFSLAYGLALALAVAVSTINRLKRGIGKPADTRPSDALGAANDP